VVARLLHAHSPRRRRPFVVVECAGLQEELLQSELFGHERGAFTGAERAKPGLFEVANGGTIFLDEIGEVSQATQVKLLRVLDTSSFRHVGGTAELHVDARVIVATNRNLGLLVRQGLFREDLFYRLSTITIELPPLRERQGDVELLVAHALARLNERYGFTRRVGDEALELLRRYAWPGNVRELLHVVESAAVLCDGEILPEHLPAALRSPAAVGDAVAAGDAQERLPSLQEVERAHIERVLGATSGHRGRAAKLLGISERSLYRKIEEYRLNPEPPARSD
jgi:DNA-binding NtrC family response regulator